MLNLRFLFFLARVVSCAFLVVPLASPARGQCQNGWKPSGGGVPGVDGPVYATAFYDDGTGSAIYVGGSFSGAGELVSRGIAKWDGTSWSSPQGGVSVRGKHGYAFYNGESAYINALVVYQGELIAGGSFFTAGGVAANSIARWNGNNWSSLGDSPDSAILNTVTSLTVYDGALIVGGSFSTMGGAAAKFLARWDGASWSSLGVIDGNGLNGAVRALTVYNGELLVGGDFTTAGGIAASHVAKWNGTAWSTLGSGASNGVNAIARALTVYNGELIAGGDFTMAGGVNTNYIARWDGGGWSPMGVGMTRRSTDSLGVVSALNVRGDRLIAGGYFTAAGGVAADSIAEWDGTTWSAFDNDNKNGAHGPVYSFSASGGHLIAGGWFDMIGSTNSSCVAEWDGLTWTPLGDPLKDALWEYINATVTYRGELVVAGRFNWFGGVSANNIASWNGSSWHSLGDGANNGVNSDVYALTVYHDELIVGGYFMRAGGADAFAIARWNGTSWSPLDNSGETMHFFGGAVHALEVYGDELIAGGTFKFFKDDGFINNIARWNGDSWQGLGSGPNNGVFGTVQALAVNEPFLFVGGSLGAAGDPNSQVRNVARWDGTSWSRLGSAANDGLQGAVNALALYQGDLYAGGEFSQLDGMTYLNHIARWNGTAWSALGTGFSVGLDQRVYALRSWNGKLVAGGAFQSASSEGTPRLTAPCIAEWNGTSWSSLGEEAANGTNDLVYALGIYANDLVVGGRFTMAGGQISTHWARWGPLGPFNPADLNEDCLVDAGDANIFAACTTGPGILYQPGRPFPDCPLKADIGGHIAADFDADGDIDQEDFAILQRCYGGLGNPADPNCVN